MDILMLTAIILIALSMLLGKPIRIVVTHKTEVPPAQLITEDKDIETEEMKQNALNIMKKFNAEWSGIIDDEEK